MVAAIQGLRGSGDFDTDHRPTNYRELYTLLEPNGTAPLNALLAMGSSEATDDPKYNNFRDELPDRSFVLAAGITADVTVGADTLAIDDNGEGKFALSGAVVVNGTTGEIMHATADSTNTLLTINRNVGTSGSPLAANTGDICFVAGFAAAEGADVGNGIGFDAVVAHNFCQIFRTPFEVTESLRNTYLRTGSKEDEAMSKALKLHMSDMERAMLFGRKVLDQTGAQDLRFTGGIINEITGVTDISVQTNGINAAADKLTETEFDKRLIDTIFKYGSKQKVCFVGANVAASLQEMGKARWAPENIDGGTYGINFTRYRTFAGDLLVHLHPQFRQLPDMASAALIVDFPFLTYRYLQSRDTQLLRDRQGNGQDTKKHEYLTECGLELLQDEVHHYIKGWDSL